MDAEVAVLKKDNKEKDILVKNIKTECANALMGKEQSSKTKMYDIENKVADLEYSNQKYIQQLHDIELKHKEELEILEEQN